MFKLNQEIKTKNTGIPTVGKIIGIVSYEYLEHQHKMMPDTRWKTLQEKYSLWNQFDKNWTEKPIYIVKFKKPQRNCTYQEYLRGKLGRTRFEYEIDVPEIICSLYPECSLEAKCEILN